METESTTERRITCRACKGQGELAYGTPPTVMVGESLHYAIERHNWQPDYETCTYCAGRGSVPASEAF